MKNAYGKFDTEEDGYTVSDGGAVRREFGLSPNGNPMNGRWVYRDRNGVLIDFDRYRNDLFERHDIRVVDPVL